MPQRRDPNSLLAESNQTLHAFLGRSRGQPSWLTGQSNLSPTTALPAARPRQYGREPRPSPPREDAGAKEQDTTIPTSPSAPPHLHIYTLVADLARIHEQASSSSPPSPHAEIETAAGRSAEESTGEARTSRIGVPAARATKTKRRNQEQSMASGSKRMQTSLSATPGASAHASPTKAPPAYVPSITPGRMQQQDIFTQHQRAFGPLTSEPPLQPVGTGIDAHAQPVRTARVAVPAGVASPMPTSTPPKYRPYTRVECEPYYVSYLASRNNSGLPPLDETAKARLGLVQHAIYTEDSTFLFVHQLVSSYGRGRQTIPRLLLEYPGFEHMMHILGSALAAAEVQDQHLMDFFSRLPCQISEIAAERPDDYQALVRHGKNLASALPKGLPRLREMCEQRGIPPVASEFAEMSVCSPTLMKLLFMETLRRLWPVSGPRYLADNHPAADQLFRESMLAYFQHVFPSNDREKLQMLTSFYINQFGLLINQLASAAGESAQQGPQAVSRQARSSPSQAPNPQPRLDSGSTLPTTNVPLDTAAQGAYVFSQGRPTIHPQGSPDRNAGAVQNGYMSQTNSAARSISDGSPTFYRQVSAFGFSRPLFHPPNAPPPDQVATPTWRNSALHQAHLQNPRFEILIIDENASEPDLYQQVTSFAIPPTRLKPQELRQTLSFHIPDADRVAVTKPNVDHGRRLRILKADSLQFRLRMVHVPDGVTDEGMKASWPVAMTSWHMHMHCRVNDKYCQVRRKQHHTKDMPADMTELVVGGTNQLDIYINLDPQDHSIAQYAVAVEIISVTKEEDIIRLSESRKIPSKDSLESIVESLNSTADDDDIIVSSATTNIQIFDPINQTGLCKIPVRSTNCKHRDCFDLESFLATRPREQPRWPAAPDSWRCPICLADCRPDSIIVDGFLKMVVESLQSTGKTKVRSITVDSQGEWRIKDGGDEESDKSSLYPAIGLQQSPPASAPVFGPQDQPKPVSVTPNPQSVEVKDAEVMNGIRAVVREASSRLEGSSHSKRKTQVIDLSED